MKIFFILSFFILAAGQSFITKLAVAGQAGRYRHSRHNHHYRRRLGEGKTVKVSDLKRMLQKAQKTSERQRKLMKKFRKMQRLVNSFKEN